MEVDQKEYERLVEREKYLEAKVEDVISSRQKTKEEKNEIKEKLTALEAENSDLQNQLKQFETFNQKVEDLQKKIIRDSVKEDLLSKMISEASKRFGAIRPNQISKLIETKNFVYDATDKQFKKPIVDVNGKIVSYQSLDDSVREFLSDEQNDNLVLSKMKIDGMGNKRNYFPAKKKSYPPEIEREADERGLAVEDWVSIRTKYKDKRIGR